MAVEIGQSKLFHSLQKILSGNDLDCTSAGEQRGDERRDIITTPFIKQALTNLILNSIELQS